MSIVFQCPVCGGEHRSRMLASRSSYFHEVVSQLGQILEPCPITGDWTPLTFADMAWKADEQVMSSPALKRPNWLMVGS